MGFRRKATYGNIRSFYRSRRARKGFRARARRYSRRGRRGNMRRIGGAKAHFFIDRERSTNILVASGAPLTWPTLSSYVSARTITSSTNDVFIYFRPRLTDSSLFQSLTGVTALTQNNFTHCKWVSCTLMFRPSVSGNTNPLSNQSNPQLITNSYMLCSKQYPYQNIPQSVATVLDSDLSTYPQCFDNPSFFKKPFTKRWNLTLKPYTWLPLATSLGSGIFTGTETFKLTRYGKMNTNDSINSWVHGACICLESMPTGSYPQTWSIETYFKFVLYNPY